MTHDPTALRNSWLALRTGAERLHALDIADRLEVSECELLAAACGWPGEVAATRLTAAWPTFIAKLPQLGLVKTVTRNRHAVIEVLGTYGAVEFFGAMGQSVSSIDLRIFAQRWKHGFAVREETKRGVSRGLQFFDEAGSAIHKIYLRADSDQAFYEALVREHTSADQAPSQLVEPAPAAPLARPDAELDAVGLRKAWLAMTDTHEFFGLLRRFGVTRTQALRLAGTDLARRVAKESFEKLLYAAAGSELGIMVFVGNPGVIQIYSGAIRKVAAMGNWVNVLDPGFDLHVRADQITSAWVVRKPTSDGIVTSLELYAESGEQIALLVGKRKPGQTENDAWRSAVEGLASEEAR